MVLLVIASTAFATNSASAHTLDLDGNISVVLHVNPNDMPSSGSPTSFILYFNDSANQFSLPKCNCRVTVLQGLHTIASEQLTDSSAMQSNDPVTFPSPGVYTIQVSSTPKRGYTFQSFFVSYNVRVIRGVHKSHLTEEIWIGVGVVVALVYAYVLIMLKKRDDKNEKKSEGSKDV